MTDKERIQFFYDRVPKYQNDALLFATEVCNFTPDDWQKEVLKAASKEKNISIRSGHGVGKTCVEALILLWFLTCFRYARVVATAPTRQQLNDVLWNEVDKWRSRSPLLMTILTWTKTYVYLKGYEKRWFAVARTASQPENMQGFHENNMLFIVDEASGVDESIMEAILATLSGRNNHLMLCGNPTKISGTFYDSHNKDRANYKTFNISSLDSPRTDKAKLYSFIKKYGEHSNVVRVRIYGDFPEQENDAFIPLSLIEDSANNELQTSKVKKIAMGVDVARFGDDETVIATNVDGKIELTKITFGQSLMTTTGNIINEYKELIKQNPNYAGTITCNIDDTGLGGGVTDRLEEVRKEEHLNRLEIVPVNFGMSPPKEEKDNYEDITSYMWGTVRTLMENKEIAIPNDDELIAQLSVRKYQVTSKGKIAVESKKNMKSRGIKSPDRADAVTLACYTTNKVYNTFLENIEAVIIPTESIKAMQISQVNIGVSIAAESKNPAFVATAIIGDYRRAVVLSAVQFKEQMDSKQLENEFYKFINDTESNYKNVDYVYCDKEEQFLYQSLKTAIEKYRIQTTIRKAANTDVNGRVKLTARLMAQNRLFLSENCDALNQAFMSAAWNTNGTTKNIKRGTRAEDITLNAFEYTIERESTRFLNIENNGGR